MDARRGTWPWVVVLAVAALAGGLAADLPVLIHIAYLLLLLLALAVLYARSSLRAVRLEHRVARRRTVVGERLLEVYWVRARALWPLFGLQVAARSGVGHERPCWALALSPRGHEELTHVAIAVARGRYSVGAALLTVSDPFGLVVARRYQPSGAEVVVWPRPRIVPDFSLAAARAGDLLPARRSWASMPVTGAVRPFAPGDASTRIHWLSSIRHGSLMVKDSERSVGQRLWVALDLSSPAHRGSWGGEGASGEGSTVERGVEAAAYVVELAYKAGLDVGLIAVGSPALLAEPRRGRDQREHLLDLLAVASFDPTASQDLAEALVERRIARPSDAVVMLVPAMPPDLLELSLRLHRLGCGVGIVLLTPEPDEAPTTRGAVGRAAVRAGASADAWREDLAGARIPIYSLQREARDRRETWARGGDDL